MTDKDNIKMPNQINQYQQGQFKDSEHLDFKSKTSWPNPSSSHNHKQQVDQPPLKPHNIIPLFQQSSSIAKELTPIQSQEFLVRFKWPLIGGISLILFLGSIFINEKGYANLKIDRFYNAIGLEKLWKGYPKEPKKAFGNILKDFAKVESKNEKGLVEFNVEKSVPVSISFFKNIPGGRILGESSKDIFKDRLNQSGNTDSFNYSIKVEFNAVGNQNGNFKTEISYDFGNFTNVLELFDKNLKDFSTIDVNVVAKDSKSYIKTPLLEQYIGEKGNKWFDIDYKESKSFQPDTFKSESSGDYKKLILSGVRGIDEEIGDTTCYYYVFDADPKIAMKEFNLSDIINGSQDVYLDQANSQAQISMWVGKKDHILRKIEVSFNIKYEGNQIEMNLTSLFSKFNQKININLPEVTEITSQVDYKKIISSLIICDLISYEKKVCNENDIQRKYDLAEIQILLELYYEKNHAYPITQGIEKISDPDSAIYKALIPIYIEELPKDPKHTNFYGYTSNGALFELSAVLENSYDPQIKKMGDKNLYFLGPL